MTKLWWWHFGGMFAVAIAFFALATIVIIGTVYFIGWLAQLIGDPLAAIIVFFSLAFIGIIVAISINYANEQTK